jgi:hypothetical protein
MNQTKPAWFTRIDPTPVTLRSTIRARIRPVKLFEGDDTQAADPLCADGMATHPNDPLVYFSPVPPQNRHA